MARISRVVTPSDRQEKWKRLWSTPKLLSESDAEAAFEEFQEQFVPSRMNKKFLQFFGNPRASFGNRFFLEDAVFHEWRTTFARLGAGDSGELEALVIYALDEQLEAHAFRGQTRRSVRDVVGDDWQAACAIVKSPDLVFYLFVEPKMKGCVVRAEPIRP